MQQRSAAIKVGVLTLVSLSLLLGVLGWLRGRSFSKGPIYKVVFDDVDGMKEGTAVQLMGIRVGFVETVAPVKAPHNTYKVQVAFRLNDPKLPLPKGSKVSIQQSGLIGEKFIELTPPLLQTFIVEPHALQLEALQHLAEHSLVPAGTFPVQEAFQEGLLNVGQVEQVERLALTQSPLSSRRSSPKFRLIYRVTYPGALLPDFPSFRLQSTPTGSLYLNVAPMDKTELLPPLPAKGLFFTIENPMRLKDYLEIQVASAESLKMMNDKLIQLLDEPTMADIQKTLSNVKQLTAGTATLINTANHLFQQLSGDLKAMVVASQSLSEQLGALAKNLNVLLGDESLQKDLKLTIHSLSTASQKLDVLLGDPALQEALHSFSTASKNVAALSATAKKTLQDPVLQKRLDHALTELDSALTQTNKVLGVVQGLDSGKDPALQSIILNAKEASSNLNTFSKRLKGRFVLWKLLF